jgi:Domain of unknown function (DUF5122) beta-propeller
MVLAVPRLRLLSAGVLAGALAFLTVAASPAQAEVHVNTRSETAWSVNGPVYASVIVGDTVIVGGDFSRATSPSGSTSRRDNLAAFSLRTGQPLWQWQTSADGPVRAMVSDGQSVWIGGEFAKINGRGRNRLVKLDARDGSVDRRFSGAANGPVRALALQDGWLYVGGSFDRINRSAPRPRAARVDAATGVVDRVFRPAPSGSVHAIVANPVTDEVYLAGSFSDVSGEKHRAVAAVDGTTGAVRETRYRPVANAWALDVSPDGHLLYAGIGGGISALAAFDTATGHRIFRKRTDGDVQTVRYHDGAVYFGFQKGWRGRTGVKLLAVDAWNGTVDPAFHPRIRGHRGVMSIAVSDAAVVAGGRVTGINGLRKQGFGVFKADLPTTEEYVGGETTWHYLDLGVRPEAWQSAGFDDSTWSVGLGSFGYGDGDERTVVASGPAPRMWYPSSYYRTTFEVGELPTALTLKLAVDDGAVVYLNGEEVARDNMPAGAAGNTTHASVSRSAAQEELLRVFVLDPEALSEGTNTLAVEVHQALGDGSDLTFDARLFGVSAP